MGPDTTCSASRGSVAHHPRTAPVFSEYLAWGSRSEPLGVVPVGHVSTASGAPMPRVGCVRTRFRVQPTLAGLRSLSNRLAEMPDVVAVAEPTSMTWLALSVALRDAGCQSVSAGGPACGPAALGDHP